MLIVDIVRIPREPKEVHSRHKDGIRWIEEGQGPERPDHVCFPSFKLHTITRLTCFQFPPGRDKVEGVGIVFID
jgi:hypothetical protein